MYSDDFICGQDGSYFCYAYCCCFLAAGYTQPSPKKPSITGMRRQSSQPKSAHPDKTDIQVNLDSVMQQVSKAIAEIDYSKMNLDIQKSLAQMDSIKLNQEIASALSKINWNDMKADVAQSLDSAKAAIAGIDWNEMKSDLAKSAGRCFERTGKNTHK